VTVLDEDFPVAVFTQSNQKVPIATPPHYHDCLEILYVIKGSTLQMINGKRELLNQGSMTVLGTGDAHAIYGKPGEDSLLLIVQFKTDVLYPARAGIYESKYMLSFLREDNEKVLHPEDMANDGDKLRAMLMGMLHEFENRETGYEICIKGYLYQLIAFMVRHGMMHERQLREEEEGLSGLQKVLLYIDKEFAEDISLQLVADMAHMSYSHFSRCFKKFTGRNFKEYLDYVRVCEAERLMVLQHMPVGKAAAEVGYANPSSFHRAFKRVRGCTPGDLLRHQKYTESNGV